jgi:S-adenosyl-L-methionine hydrolase (adenosine-forming)
MSIITLLTDFGTEDEYVGLMKGVILSIDPRAAIVDITHQIDSQDTVRAAYTIHASYRYFPPGSVHLIVVDPGVGTGRAVLALEMRKHIFIAPDNGILTRLLDDGDTTELVRISNTDYFLNPVSRTFHGRDIFAPVGAHIARGVALNRLGPQMNTSEAVRLDNLQARLLPNGEIVGEIIAIDHFGNLISNVEMRQLAQYGQADQTTRLKVTIGSRVIHGLSDTYGNAPPNTVLALIGSRGYLEIAVNCGSAARQLNVRRGDSVRVNI